MRAFTLFYVEVRVQECASFVEIEAGVRMHSHDRLFFEICSHSRLEDMYR